MPLELSQISAAQLESLPRKKTVFLFPVGPIEDHGPHLPLGLDVEEARRMCLMVACRIESEMPDWKAVLMPSAPLGIESNSTHLALTVRSHVLRDWLVDACYSLIRREFIHFVCFTGHLGPKQLTAIEEAGGIVRRMGRWHFLTRGISFFAPRSDLPSLVSANSSLVSFKEVFASPFWPDPKEHGGDRDTSIALWLAGGKLEAPTTALPNINQSSSRWMRNLKRRTGRLSGYWGNPQGANAVKGEALAKATLDQVFPKLRAVWEGAPPNRIFKSWYSIFPVNKSFFKSWLLAVSILLLMVIWILQIIPGVE